MRTAGIEGVRRGRQVRNTQPDPAALRHPDLMKRDFTAKEPNQLWVTYLTYVPTWAGVAYVCFIVDVHSRTIVGWRVAGHMRTEMASTHLEWPGGAAAPASTGYGVTATPAVNSPPSDTASGSPRSAAPRRSGTVGDSYTNALAETVNGYYKAELIYGPGRPGPWRTVEDVEFATLGCMHWHNTARLHGYLGV